MDVELLPKVMAAVEVLEGKPSLAIEAQEAAPEAAAAKEEKDQEPAEEPEETAKAPEAEEEAPEAASELISYWRTRLLAHGCLAGGFLRVVGIGSSFTQRC